MGAEHPGVRPGSVVILVGSHADEAASPAAAERTCKRVLERLSQVLEEQRDGLRAELVRLEAELPDEDQRHSYHYHYLPETELGRQIRLLRQLLDTPLRLSDEPVVVSAQSHLNVDVLRGRIADALFDPQSFPEFGRQEPRSYQRSSGGSSSWPSRRWSGLPCVRGG